RWMQRHGILVDLSHASADTARDVLDQSIAPLIFSHSSAAALCDVSRNVPDDVLRRMRGNGGIVMVSFVPEFTSKAYSDWYDAGSVYATQVLKRYNGDRAATKPFMDAWEQAHPAPPVTVADVADHVEHVRDVAGIDHVGLGSDFDGIEYTVNGLEDVSKFTNLFEELARRGWSDADLRKVAGENFLRVLNAADAVRDALLPTSQPADSAPRPKPVSADH
ncbi:MAG: membrane dipeptidase, partial [Rudaea sp.]